MTICEPIWPTSEDVASRGCWASHCFGRQACSLQPEHEASCSSRIGLHSRGCLAGRWAATSSHHMECGNSSAPRRSGLLRLTGTRPGNRYRICVWPPTCVSTSDLIDHAAIASAFASTGGAIPFNLPCHQPESCDRRPQLGLNACHRTPTNPNNFKRRLTSVRAVVEISQLHPNRAHEHRDKRRPGGIDEDQDVTYRRSYPHSGRDTARASYNRRVYRRRRSCSDEQFSSCAG